MHIIREASNCILPYVRVPYLQGLGRLFIAIYLRKRQRYADTTKPGPYSMNVNQSPCPFALTYYFLICE